MSRTRRLSALTPATVRDPHAHAHAHAHVRILGHDHPRAAELAVGPTLRPGRQHPSRGGQAEAGATLHLCPGPPLPDAGVGMTLILGHHRRLADEDDQFHTLLHATVETNARGVSFRSAIESETSHDRHRRLEGVGGIEVIRERRLRLVPEARHAVSKKEEMCLIHGCDLHLVAPPVAVGQAVEETGMIGSRSLVHRPQTSDGGETLLALVRHRLAHLGKGRMIGAVRPDDVTLVLNLLGHLAVPVHPTFCDDNVCS